MGRFSCFHAVAVAGASLAVLLAVGCGDSDDGTSPGGTTTTDDAGVPGDTTDSGGSTTEPDSGAHGGKDAGVATDSGPAPKAWSYHADPFGAVSVIGPVTAIDTASSKVLVAAATIGDGKETTSVVRCNANGSGCTTTDISTGLSATNDHAQSIAVDAANAKVLVAVSDNANGVRPALYRCNLDLTGCTFTDISASAGGDSASATSIAVDSANGKVLVATAKGNGDGGLFRCNLDATGCTYTVFSHVGYSNGLEPSIVVDATNQKILVAARDYTADDKLVLHRCAIDGTSCTPIDISAGAAASTGDNPSAAIDSVAHKLLVVTRDHANGDRIALTRCELDGTACTRTDVSAGAGVSSGLSPSMALDPTNGTFVVATRDNSNAGKPALFRCKTDGTGCTYTKLDGASRPITFGAVSLAVAPTGDMAIADDISNGIELATFH
ncbi:MAG TPA: hypothetical protein VF407_01165 [Polyangiaceae bacterium]